MPKITDGNCSSEDERSVSDSFHPHGLTAQCAFPFLELDDFMAVCQSSVLTQEDLDSISRLASINLNGTMNGGTASSIHGSAIEESDRMATIVPLENRNHAELYEYWCELIPGSVVSVPGSSETIPFIDPFWHPGNTPASVSGTNLIGLATATPRDPFNERPWTYMHDNITVPGFFMNDVSAEIDRKLFPYNLDSGVFWGMEESKESEFLQHFNEVAYGQYNAQKQQQESQMKYGTPVSSYPSPPLTTRPPPGLPAPNPNEPPFMFSTWEPLKSKFRGAYSMSRCSSPSPPFRRLERGSATRYSYREKRARSPNKSKYCIHCHEMNRSFEVVHSHNKLDAFTGKLTCKFLTGNFKD